MSKGVDLERFMNHLENEPIDDEGPVTD